VAQYEVRDDAPDDSQEYGQQEPQAASGSFRVHVYRLSFRGKYRGCQELLPSGVDICDGSGRPGLFGSGTKLVHAPDRTAGML